MTLLSVVNGMALHKKKETEAGTFSPSGATRPSLAFLYRSADKSLARLTFRCIWSDGENISCDASLVMYINSTNIPPIMIINRIYEHQNVLSP
jgi:hypothetical protein